MYNKLSHLELEIGIDKEHATAIGYFLMAFSFLEDNLNRSIWAVLGLSPTKDSSGSILTTTVRDFGQRMLLLAKLGKERLSDQKNRDDCAKVIKAIQFINDQRVNLVHGVFTAYNSKDSTSYLSRTQPDRTAVRHLSYMFTTDYLCELAEFTMETTGAVVGFRQNLQSGTDHALPSLDKRPEPPR